MSETNAKALKRNKKTLDKKDNYLSFILPFNLCSKHRILHGL